MPGRPHAFQKKTTLREKCSVCDKKIKWGKSCLKCQDCGVVCHPECKFLKKLSNYIKIGAKLSQFDELFSNCNIT